jgi:UDP-glucose 4-epimerase
MTADLRHPFRFPEVIAVNKRSVMTVLVTGGAGYIGSHMVRALVDAGKDIVVLDDLTSAPALSGWSTLRRPSLKGMWAMLIASAAQIHEVLKGSPKLDNLEAIIGHALAWGNGPKLRRAEAA